LDVGRALGREPAGREAQAAFDKAIAEAETKATRARAARGKAPRVLFVVDRRPGSLSGMVAAGPGSYLDDLVTRAGGENVLATAKLRYAQITAEEVITLAPDLILDAAHVDDATRALTDWDILKDVPAVAGKRVFVLADPSFVTPGPRLATAFPRLVSLLWD
jgi:iron complex transport system substrate-binding protein